ncbi:signal peptidase I [Nocardioides sp. MAHUQ-72]|uniref:signal peptidase I n=1 Tax=unclassified Nocardioides TaxID=2615069 RepID=UPI00360B2219
MSLAAPSPRTLHRGASAAAGLRRVARLVRVVLVNGLLVGCLLVFLLLAVGPHVLGYRTATMLTGSMEPGIMPGDVVVTVPRPAADLRVGDVISYHIPIEDHRVETHRVTKVVRGEDGSITFRTKGDNNPGVDPWTATLQGDTVWEKKAVIPKLGSAIRVLRDPVVRHWVFWVSVAGLLLLGLSLIWGGSDDDQDDDEDEDASDGASGDGQFATSMR